MAIDHPTGLDLINTEALHSSGTYIHTETHTDTHINTQTHTDTHRHTQTHALCGLSM